MSAFDIINAGFARHVLGNATTGDPVRDCAHALTMNHTLKKGSKSRLTGWAIFRASGAVVQADLAATEFVTGDKRTRYEAFAEELGNLQEPAVPPPVHESNGEPGQRVFHHRSPNIKDLLARDATGGV